MGYNLAKKNPLYELIADYTVSGSAITSYTFSGLNITKDEDYVLVYDNINPTTDNMLRMTVNGNDTLTNYYTQRLQASSTTVSSGRDNSPDIGVANASSKIEGFVSIKLTNSGYFVLQSKVINKYSGSSAEIINYNATSTFTMSSITSLKIQTSSVSAIGIGSRFQLYRIRPASKIADVTIGSATTSYTFDLSATPIGKGSEFMLVSDVSNIGGTASGLYVYVNDNVTNSNYYRQRVIATGTSVIATRYNEPSLLVQNSNKTFSIANLKLSNNGYFIFQSSTNRGYDSGSSSELENIYGTTTFTMSSISKITLTASATNGLGIGTRFQLYKLK